MLLLVQHVCYFKIHCIFFICKKKLKMEDKFKIKDNLENKDGAKKVCVCLDPAGKKAGDAKTAGNSDLP